jgi:hypothetical protein
MDPVTASQLIENRRQFFGRATIGIGSLALASLLNPKLFAASHESALNHGGLPGLPHFAAMAKRVIYLLQSGAPSQMELLDYKPSLKNLHGKPLPDSVRKGQRLTGMTAGQN